MGVVGHQEFEIKKILSGPSKNFMSKDPSRDLEN